MKLHQDFALLKEKCNLLLARLDNEIRERDTLINSATKRKTITLIEKILPVIDSFYRACENRKYFFGSSAKEEKIAISSKNRDRIIGLIDDFFIGFDLVFVNLMQVLSDEG